MDIDASWVDVSAEGDTAPQSRLCSISASVEKTALASDALVATEAGVLVSPDRGCTFRPRPVAPGAREEVKARQLLDLELLGRLLGLALLQQATVGFRLHASV